MLGIAILISAIVTGKIKFFAAGNPQITNTATATYQDASGNTVTVQSNTVATDIISNPDVNITCQLSGKVNSGAININLRVYQAGTTTKVFEKTDVTTNDSGQTALSVSGLTAGQNCDFILKPGYFLGKKATSVYTSGMTLSFGALAPGDLNNNNQIEANDLSIIISAYRTIQGDATFNPIADLKQDNQINAQDISMLINNWRKLGD